MKKSIIAGLLIFSFVVAPVAQADTLSDLQAQIASLLAQVRSLQAQVSVAQSQNSSGGGSGGGGGSVSQSPAICSAFNRYLVAGTALRDQEATSLYNILVKEGLWEVNKELTVFDDDVASAVISFQEKYGIRRTGTVGPITRAKLNSLYGCGVTIPRRNLPPAISGLEAPTTLNVGQTGTWTIRASDPENGPLSYSVSWGDESSGTSALTIQPPPPPAQQTSTFTHSYSRAGNYTIKFTVFDNAGNRQVTSATVQVGNTIQPSITVLSPNGNTWVRGTRQEIIWTSNNVSRDSTVDISLVREGTTDYYDIANVYDRPLNTGSYMWEVGKTSEGASMDRDGSYWVRVCTPSRSVCNTTGGKVTMTASTTQSSVSATLVSADEDRAGVWGEFKPNGRSDWKWSSVLTLGSSKIIKSMELIANNNGEGWSTKSGSNNPLGKGLYPLNAFINGVQIYTAYDQTHEIGNAGEYKFLLYGQPGLSNSFPGGTLTVEFTDGTSISSKIPASSITPVQGDLQSALTFKVSTDKGNYSPDETIGITISVVNNTAAEKTLRWNTGCQVSYAVAFYDSTDKQVCTQALTSVVIPAYGVKSWTVLHSPSVYRVPSGGYKLVGRVIGYGEATTPITVSGAITKPSASVTSSKLSLGYDSQNKEASLTAVFTISVTAGSANLEIDQDGGLSAFFANASSGLSSNTNSYRQSLRVLSGNVGTTLGQYDISLYLIRAGETASFEVTITQNPKEMFAGTYYGRLTAVNGPAGGPVLQPPGQTNRVTIVGEVSPYLTSAEFIGNLSTNGLITLKGTRFASTNNIVTIGGKEFSFPSGNNGSTISFSTYGLGLSSGPQEIFVTNADLGRAAGKSNTLFVNLKDSTQSVPRLNVSLDSSSPASASLVPGQTNVTFAMIRADALDKPVNNLNGIQVGSDTTGADKLIQNVRVFDGSTQIGNVVPILSYNGSYYYGWVNVSNVLIPAFTSKLFRVVADIATGATGSVRAGIAGWNFASPGGDVQPSVSVYGNVMTIKAPGDGNLPPVINNLSAPSVLKIGETGTWTLKATDPENGILRYSVNWGDQVTSGRSGLSSIASAPVEQTSSFTHSYRTAGAFTVKFTVTDNKGQSAETTSVVNVGSVAQPSITVISPNGAEILDRNGISTIKWKTLNVDKVSVALYKNDSFDGWIALDLSVPSSGDGSLTWTPSRLVAPIEENQSVFKIYITGQTQGRSGSPEDKSDLPFSLTSSPVNRPPVINGLTAPTTLGAGETGTWTVRATDPESDSLSYSVSWGDEIGITSGLTIQPLPPPIQQISTFTHSYSRAGNYTAKFTVYDNAGNQTETSATVQVGSAIVNNPPKIVVVGSIPEDIQVGQTVNFSWTATDADNDDLNWSLRIEGPSGGSGGGGACPIPHGKNGARWTHSTNQTFSSAGTYKITATVSDCAGGSDSNSFTVKVENPASVVNLRPGYDHFFSIKPGSKLTFGEIFAEGFAVSPTPGNRVDELFTFSSSPVGTKNSANASYYYWNGAWRKVGSGFLVIDPSASPSDYFVIRHNGTTDSTLRLPDVVKFYGAVPKNTFPSPWDQMSQPSITVISPNGGEVFTPSLSAPEILIRWNNPTGFTADNSTVTINFCSVGAQVTTCPAPGSTNVVGGLRNVGEYRAVIMTPSGTPSPAGRYVVNITAVRSDGLTAFDSSDNYFTITAPTSTNRSPIINGLTAPTILKAGETGTWTIRASDPENGSLNYSVSWGDEAQELSGAIRATPIVQTSTFTHSYSRAGTYTAKFTVFDNAGNQTETSATVQVGSSAVNNPPKITPFTVPSFIQTNQSVNFTWSATDADNDDLLWSVNWGDGSIGPVAACFFPRRQNGSNWTNNTNHAWSQAGTYTVKVAVTDCVGGNDSTSFTVKVENPINPTPSITVLSPNGGEIFPIGSKQNINWSTSGSNIPSVVKIYYRIPKQGAAYQHIVDVSTFSGAEIWAVPNVEPGQYVIKITLGDFDVDCERTPEKCDESNSPFTITAPNPQPIITFPSSGSVLEVGKTYNVTWSNGGNATYQVYVTGGGVGTSYQYIGTASGDGPLSWTLSALPTFTTASNYRLQLRSVTYPGTEIQLSQLFTISVPLWVNLKVNSSDAVSSIQNNSQAKISWTASGANSCTASGSSFKLADGTGSWADNTHSNLNTAGSNVDVIVATSGTLPSTLKVGIQCVAPNGSSVTDEVPVTITAPATAVPLPTVTLSSNFTSVPSGSSVLLSWSSTNATRCTAYSSHAKWGGGRPLVGNQLVDAITATMEFRLECANSEGKTSSASVTVTVPSSEPIVSSTAPTASAARAAFISGSIYNQLASIAAALERIRLQILGLGVR